MLLHHWSMLILWIRLKGCDWLIYYLNIIILSVSILLQAIALSPIWNEVQVKDCPTPVLTEGLFWMDFFERAIFCPPPHSFQNNIGWLAAIYYGLTPIIKLCSNNLSFSQVFNSKKVFACPLLSENLTQNVFSLDAHQWG